MNSFISILFSPDIYHLRLSPQVLGAFEKELMHGNVFEVILHRLPEVKTLHVYRIFHPIIPLLTFLEGCDVWT